MSNSEHPDFVTTYESIGGWKAVYMTWTEDPECGGFYEPWNTGYFAYKTEDRAILEAKDWAEAEEIAYISRKGGEKI